MAVSAVIGVGKGIRLLQALGVRFTAQAVGPQPPKKELDEACDEISAALNQHPQTTAADLASLCRRHQRIKHETAWTYTLPNGIAVWVAPSGRTYTDQPDQLGDDPVLTDYLAKAAARRAAEQAAAGPTAKRPRTRPDGDPWLTPPDTDADDEAPF